MGDSLVDIRNVIVGYNIYIIQPVSGPPYDGK